MNTEDLACNNRGNWKTVESIDKGFPDLDVAPALTLIIESIHYGWLQSVAPLQYECYNSTGT